MEDRHKKILVESFRTALEGKSITVLDIPDEYSYMDPELIEELTDVVNHYL